MLNGDLRVVLLTARINPEMLPFLLDLYKLGRKQGMIDILRNENRSFWGINYGSEMKASN